MPEKYLCVILNQFMILKYWFLVHMHAKIVDKFLTRLPELKMWKLRLLK
jgi:hypothetical protein